MKSFRLLLYYFRKLFRIKSKRQEQEEYRKRIVDEDNDLLDLLSKLPDFALVDLSERYKQN